MSEIALPSRHSTGLVCEEMDPMLFNGSGLLKSERSLNHRPEIWRYRLLFIENAPKSYNLVWTSCYQNLETREDEQSFDKVIMGVRRWRYQFISLCQTITTSHFALGWRHDIRLYPRAWLTDEGVMQLSVREECKVYLIPSTTYQNFFISWSYLSITESKTGNRSSMTLERCGKRFSSLTGFSFFF